MAKKLNQVIAVEKNIKGRALQELTEAHHSLQKTALLAGIARTYRPRDEESEQFPLESTKVQLFLSHATAASTTESCAV